MARAMQYIEATLALLAAGFAIKAMAESAEDADLTVQDTNIAIGLFKLAYAGLTFRSVLAGLHKDASDVSGVRAAAVLCLLVSGASAFVAASGEEEGFGDPRICLGATIPAMIIALWDIYWSAPDFRGKSAIAAVGGAGGALASAGFVLSIVSPEGPLGTPTMSAGIDIAFAAVSSYFVGAYGSKLSGVGAASMLAAFAIACAQASGANSLIMFPLEVLAICLGCTADNFAAAQARIATAFRRQQDAGSSATAPLLAS